MSNPTEIYVDPAVGQAPVIRVNGACYSRVGLIDQPPTVHSVEAEYYDCDSCAQSSSSSSSGSSRSSGSSCSPTRCGSCLFYPRSRAVMSWSWTIDPGALDLYGSGRTWADASPGGFEQNYDAIKSGSVTSDPVYFGQILNPTTGATVWSVGQPYGTGRFIRTTSRTTRSSRPSPAANKSAARPSRARARSRSVPTSLPSRRWAA